MRAVRSTRAACLIARIPAIGLLWVALVLAPAALRAQDGGPPLTISAAPRTGELEIHIGDLFEEPGLTRALHSGLPLRIQIVAELWKDGFFDSQKGRAEWRASVLYDPLEQMYRVASVSGTAEITVDSLAGVREALRESFSMPLHPMEAGRYYYLGQVVVETLSLSDLGELQRWLRGDLASAVKGDAKVETAVGRGMGRVIVRMLGLPARRLKVRTAKFEVGPPEPR